MRFIVDESTGAAVVEYLRRNGHDALAVAEAMPQADDRDIIARGERGARLDHERQGFRRAGLS